MGNNKTSQTRAKRSALSQQVTTRHQQTDVHVSRVSTCTNPCINKEIHMLLIHRIGTLDTLVPGHDIFLTADSFIAIIYSLALEHKCL